MTASNPRAALFAAMAKAFPEIEGATKDSNNPHFKSKYADLGAVVDAIKPALVKHQLWFRQAFHDAQGGVAVETLICHASGEEVSCGVLFVPASKQDAQGYGSAITYARRYSLQTAFGVAPEDDDGDAASKPKPQAKPAADEPGGAEDEAAKWKAWATDRWKELAAMEGEGDPAKLNLWRQSNATALHRLHLHNQDMHEKLMGKFDDVYALIGGGNHQTPISAG
jgi:hypothetical protein